jgi:hypothetical protein
MGATHGMQVRPVQLARKTNCSHQAAEFHVNGVPITVATTLIMTGIDCDLNMMTSGHYYNVTLRDDDAAIVARLVIFWTQNELVNESKHCTSGLVLVNNHIPLIP